MKRKKQKKGRGRIVAAAAVVLVALALLAALAGSKVLSVREIMIVGNRNQPAEEIIALSGVKIGENYLSVTNERLRKNLERNRYIEYVGRGFDYKGRLTIRINERLGKAFVRVNGLFYFIDEKGMVLEQMGGVYPDGLTGIEVTGLTMDSHAVPVEGQIFPVQDKSKLEIMESLIGLLEDTSLIGRIAQINLSNTNNISMTTSDGAKIEMGDGTNQRIKILIAREVISIEEQQGSLKGVKIDVSNGREGHFIPAMLPTPTPVPTATPDPAVTPTPT